MRVTPAVRAVLTWLAVAAIFGAVVLAVHREESPLDDVKPADQRPGYLDAVGPRGTAPLVTISIPARGQVAVIFFVRDAQQQRLLSALSRPGALPPNVDAAVVGGRPNLTEGPFAVVTDTDGSLARAYHMPVPRDGGYPVGYAIVGAGGAIRYRTLDPDAADHLHEVRTMAGALK